MESVTLRPGLPKWCHPRIFLFFPYGRINVSSIGICKKIDTVTGYFSQQRCSNIGPIYIGSYGKYRFKLSRNSAFSPKLHPRRFLKTNIVSTNVWWVCQCNKSSWQPASLAHLSRRLTRWAYSITMVRRPSVIVCRLSSSSTLSNLNISEASWPILIKFYVLHHWGGGKAA